MNCRLRLIVSSLSVSRGILLRLCHGYKSMLAGISPVRLRVQELAERATEGVGDAGPDRWLDGLRMDVQFGRTG